MLLVSGVFVVLTATLRVSDLSVIDEKAVEFIVVLLVLVRPVSVFLVTIGSGLSWRERLLVGWIAPRGVVAVAVAGLFGALLAEHGVADAHRLIPLAFAIVFVTVILHGFTIGPLSRVLGLSAAGPVGVLIVGGSAFATEFARGLKESGAPGHDRRPEFRPSPAGAACRYPGLLRRNPLGSRRACDRFLSLRLPRRRHRQRYPTTR